MHKFIRKCLRDHAWLYAICASAYHMVQNLIMRFQLFPRGVKYLPPQKGGEKYKSQFGQDYYLEKLGLLKKNGYFVEVGCNHPVMNSNSHFLEHEFGYSGVSIDALDYKAEFETFRPKTKFVRSLVDTTEKVTDFYVVSNEEGWENQLSSVYKDTIDKGKGFNADVIEIQSRRLSSILENREAIDILLVDVEGHEFSVLESMDWATTVPKVILIENNGEYYPRKQLERYLFEKGYSLLARIGTIDDIYVPSRPKKSMR